MDVYILQYIFYFVNKVLEYECKLGAKKGDFLAQKTGFVIFYKKALKS